MKIKYRCSKCRTEVMINDAPADFACRCPKCGTVMWDDKFFPSDSKNKVYAVDIFVDVSRCLKFEAASKEEAEEKAEEFMADKLKGCTSAEAIDELKSIGFEDSGNPEFKASGEADEQGDIQYY